MNQTQQDFSLKKAESIQEQLNAQTIDNLFCHQFQTLNSPYILRKKINQRNTLSRTIFLPGYLRVHMKSIESISIKQAKADASIDIIFSIYLGSLFQQQQIIDEIKDKLTIRVNQEIIKLEAKQELVVKLKEQKQKCSLQFTIRKIIKLKIINQQNFDSIFQLMILELKIAIGSINLSLGDCKIGIKFNLLNLEKDTNFNRDIMFSIVPGISFGQYDIASNIRSVQYSTETLPSYQKKKKNKKKKGLQPKESQNEKTDDKKILHIQYAHFAFTIYKHPQSAILTIFLPLIMLSIINTFVLFEPQQNKLSIVATVILSLISLVSYIREQQPPNPSWSIIEYIISLQVMTDVFVLLDSINEKHIKLNQFLIVLSFLLILLSIGYIGYKFYNFYQKEKYEYKDYKQLMELEPQNLEHKHYHPRKFDLSIWGNQKQEQILKIKFKGQKVALEDPTLKYKQKNDIKDQTQIQQSGQCCLDKQQSQKPRCCSKTIDFKQYITKKQKIIQKWVVIFIVIVFSMLLFSVFHFYMHSEQHHHQEKQNGKMTKMMFQELKDLRKYKTQKQKLLLVSRQAKKKKKKQALKQFLEQQKKSQSSKC